MTKSVKYQKLNSLSWPWEGEGKKTELSENYEMIFMKELWEKYFIILRKNPDKFEKIRKRSIKSKFFLNILTGFKL